MTEDPQEEKNAILHNLDRAYRNISNDIGVLLGFFERVESRLEIIEKKIDGIFKVDKKTDELFELISGSLKEREEVICEVPEKKKPKKPQGYISYSQFSERYQFV